METTHTVLLIEDESHAVFAIEKSLTSAGFSVLSAFSAQEGLKLALEKHPDAIILDVMMPAENGLNILPELREDSWGKNAKIIVFSNLSSDAFKATANKYHVDKYLIKTDTSLKELEEILRNIQFQT